MRSLTPKALISLLFLFFILIAIIGIGAHVYQLEVNLRQAENAIRKDAPKDASNYFANAAASAPWRPDLWEQAGHYALETNDPQAAIGYFEKAEQAGKESFLHNYAGLSSESRVELGKAHKLNGDIEAALIAWQAAASMDNPSVELLENILQVQFELDDLSAANATLHDLITIQPNNADFHYQLGLTTAAQEPEAALEYLNKASSLDRKYERRVSILLRSIIGARFSEDPSYSLMEAGRAMAILEEWYFATKAFHQATYLRPDFPEAWAYLGESLQHIDSTNGSNNYEALNALRKAYELNPESVAANSFLSIYWSRQGEYDLALSSINSAVTHDPNNSALYIELGNLLALTGDLHHAYEAFENAISFSPNDPEYLRHLVDFSIRYEFEIEEIGLPLARRLVIQEPYNPANHDLMGQVLISKGDLASAERFLKRAIELNPDFAPAHLHLGLVYILIENNEDALAELKLASSLAPDSWVSNHVDRLMETYYR